jgi:hypothetical protein
MTMPTFEIPDGPTTVELKRTGDATSPGPATGSIVFNVTNKSGDACDGRLGVIVSGDSKEAWFSVEGDRERTFAAGETQTATINISAPPGTAAGNYPFRLRAVAVNDPDNDHAEGPVATAQVPGAAPVGKKPMWWLWILIALVVLILIAGALWFAFGRGGGEEPVVAEGPPAPTQKPPATQPAPPVVAQPSTPVVKPVTPVFKPPAYQLACNLSGVWHGNDGGTYRITQSGTTITWRGTSADGGRSWANNFRGLKEGTLIKGPWYDTTGPMGKGVLTLRVNSPTRITRLANTGSGFGGTEWTRKACG